MEAQDVMSLPWKKVTDWSELSASHEEQSIFDGGYYVCERDVDAFIENLFRDIARQLKTPYEQLESILRDENAAFYSLKKSLFAKNVYERGNSRLVQLQNTLRVPDTKPIIVDKVADCLKLFEELSDIEKTVFFQKIGKIKVKIERLVVETEETTVD